MIVLKHFHLKAIIAIFIIITIGMGISSFLTYRASIRRIGSFIEEITDLTSNSIHYRIEAALAKPVNISLTMANDIFLIGWMERETEYFDEQDHIQIVADYLSAYKKQHGYEAMFLASAKTNRLYTSRGFDRTISASDPEEEWFSYTSADDAPYNINIDIDKAAGGERAVNIYVNCHMRDNAGNIIGIVGVGYRIDHFQKLLTKYEEEFGVNAMIFDRQGRIAIAGEQTESSPTVFLSSYGKEDLERLLKNAETGAQMFWKEDYSGYILVRFIPEASWFLIIEHDTESFNRQAKFHLAKTWLVGAGILFGVLAVVFLFIRRFNRQIIDLTVAQEQEKLAMFRMATEKLYDNIYEFNLSENCAVGLRTKQYFKSIDIPESTPYYAALEKIAEKRIKEDFREGFVSIFSPERLIAEFNGGKSHFRYEVMAKMDGVDYIWIQIEAYVYRSPEDGLIHAFTYLKNIDKEKQRELQISMQAQLDEMTMTYNKSTTERRIKEILAGSENNYALFIMDIDDFKNINDCYGHAFGDLVIMEFASVIKRTFRQGDIVGRVGGDEFVVFIPVPDADWVRKKTAELSKALDMGYSDDTTSCNITASIGVAVSFAGADACFEELFKNADKALYQTKRNGKNGYSFYSE